MKRLRKLFESVAYAGMKPALSAAPGPPLRWLGPLRGPVERFLNGTASPDPLYLSNRTLGQKIRRGALLALPCIAVLTLVALAVLGKFDAAHLRPPAEPLPDAEIAARMLPGLNRDLTLDGNPGLQVIEAAVSRGRIAGTVRNPTGRAILDTELIFDLTDAAGSRLGAVSCRLPRVEPRGTAPFQSPVPQADAAHALVREIRAH